MNSYTLRIHINVLVKDIASKKKDYFFWLTLEHFHYLEDAKKRMTELLKQRQEEETIFYPENPKIKASGGELTLIDEKNK